MLWSYTIFHGFGSTKYISKNIDVLLSKNNDSLQNLHETIPKPIQQAAEREIELARSLDISVTCIHDDDYPQSLLSIPDPPLVLFYRGSLHPVAHVAIVGARSCTNYGFETSYRIAKMCTQHGLAVVSGLARGIDAAAHRGAIDSARSNNNERRTAGLAVLGTGIDILYPRSNLQIAESLLEHDGAIVSEFGLGRRGRKYHFPRRNRIISGLCSSVVVVEAMEKSGSLITAEFGMEQGRDIFAVPGAIASPLSDGCNHLIEKGAMILRSPEQLIEYIYQDMRCSNRVKKPSSDNPIINILKKRGEVEFSQLLLELDVEVPFLRSELTKLEIMGEIGFRANSIIFFRN